jgi:serine/threonine protein kinase/uncharacterized protein YraI
MMNDELIDTYLGQYHLTGVIGRGGMATVYRAYQESLDRYVAIKVLVSNHDPQFAARFKREARAIARLQHPNILTIHDHGEQNGLLYLVLQYIENGTTLTDMLGKPMPSAQALRLIGLVLDGLEYAHACGVVHRDIKPSNILMASPRWPMLADFGIAKLLGDSQPFTQPGLVMGTAAYMAPELAFGRPADAGTDLYALGIVLYEMITGRVPFDADTPVAMLHQHAYEPPPRPCQLNPDVPAVVEAAVLRMLAKKPEQRYQSATKLAAALEQVSDQLHRTLPHSRVTDLYQTGVQAFEAGEWDRAIEQLSRLVALDTSNEDAAELLEAARAAQAQARANVHSGQQPRLNLPHQPAIPVVPPPAAPVIRETSALTTEEQIVRADENDPAPDNAVPHPQSGRLWMWPAVAGTLAVLAIAAVLALRSSSAGDPAPIGAGQATGSANQRPAQLAPAPSTVLIVTAIPVSSAVASATTTPNPTLTVAPSADAAPTAIPTSPATAIPTPPLAPAPNAITVAKVNLRKGPATGFSSLGIYEQGTALHVTGKAPAGDWIRVETPDRQAGWMLAKNVQLNMDLAGVPVVAAPPAPTARPTPKPSSTAPPSPQPTLAAPTDTPPPPPSPTETPSPTRKHSSGGGGGCGGGCPPPQP